MAFVIPSFATIALGSYVHMESLVATTLPSLLQIVLAVGVVIGVAVLGYVLLHRDEIIAILTQSPA